MASLEELKAGVRRSLPEVHEIQDEGLREKVVHAWALGLSQTEFTSIDQIRASGNPDTPAMARRYAVGPHPRRHENGVGASGRARTVSSVAWESIAIS